MRNNLRIQWANGSWEGFRKITTENAAMDIIFKRNTKEMKKALWYDNEGVEKQLIPKYQPKT
ncbi:MAG TPA: hypothetical protein VGZ90_13410 [Puia sp.]|jgi:hypothetical protein|nr:hypothetical protein [Puia sp.]